MTGESKKLHTKLGKGCVVGITTALMAMVSVPSPTLAASFGLPSSSHAALNQSYVKKVPAVEVNRSNVLLADYWDDSADNSYYYADWNFSGGSDFTVN